jgi:hypothetical protein
VRRSLDRPVPFRRARPDVSNRFRSTAQRVSDGNRYHDEPNRQSAALTGAERPDVVPNCVNARVTQALVGSAANPHSTG